MTGATIGAACPANTSISIATGNKECFATSTSCISDSSGTLNSSVSFSLGAAGGGGVLSFNGSAGQNGFINGPGGSTALTFNSSNGMTLGYNLSAASVIGCVSNNSCGLGARGVVWTREIVANSPLILDHPSESGWYMTITNADTAFTAVGMPAPTLLTCGGTVAADTTQAAWNAVKFPTTAVSGNACAISGPFTTTKSGRLPVLSAVIFTDPSAVTSVRYYIGFGASSLDQAATLAAANGVRGCWFRFDTGLADANWTAQSSDGTTASATATSTAVAAATVYRLAIDNSVSGICDFYINGVRATSKNNNINPASDTTSLGVEVSVTTLTTAARNLSIAKVNLLQN